jgi:hypothetical protein
MQPAEASSPAARAADTAAAWRGMRRGAWSVLSLHLVLYDLTLALAWLPGAARLQDAWLAVAGTVVPWVGRHLLRLDRQVAATATGSADRAFDHVEALCLAVAATVAVLAWSAAHRGREDRLPERLATALRLTLGTVLLILGLRTILRLGLPFPALGRLSERIGDSSPLALYSAFAGLSPLYAGFTGGVAALGGILLWFRRPAPLGALVGLGALANAAMLDLSYDVPRKLADLHLLLSAVVVLAPEARRLADGLLLGRPTRPVPSPLPPAATGGRRAGSGATATGTAGAARAALAVPVLKVLALAGVAAATVLPALLRPPAPRPPLYGIYEVEELRRDGHIVPPSASDAARWRQLVVASPAALEVRFIDGSRQSFRTTYRARQVTLAVADATPPGAESGTLAWSRPAADRLLLTGIFAGHPLAMALRRVDTGYLLVSRPFQVIVDDPINR